MPPFHKILATTALSLAAAVGRNGCIAGQQTPSLGGKLLGLKKWE